MVLNVHFVHNMSTPPPRTLSCTSSLTSTETIRLFRDGDKGGGGGGGGGRLYTYRYTVTTGMTSALRWAAMRAILMYHNCDGQSHKTVSTDHTVLQSLLDTRAIGSFSLCNTLYNQQLLPKHRPPYPHPLPPGQSLFVQYPI